jgi:hypothetical protein
MIKNCLGTRNRETVYHAEKNFSLKLSGSKDSFSDLKIHGFLPRFVYTIETDPRN